MQENMSKYQENLQEIIGKDLKQAKFFKLTKSFEFYVQKFQDAEITDMMELFKKGVYDEKTYRNEREAGKLKDIPCVPKPQSWYLGFGR